MDKQFKLSEWIQRFKSGEFDKPDTTTQIKAGWFDWFCRDTSLANKKKEDGKHHQANQNWWESRP